MSYIKDSLTLNEVVKYKATLSKLYFLPLLITGGVFSLLGGIFMLISLLFFAISPETYQEAKVTFYSGLFLVALAAFFIGWVVISIRTTEIAITNQRVLHKTGLIRRITTEIALAKIESVDVRQGILGRMLGFGHVRVHGTGMNSSLMRGIIDPLKFRSVIMAVDEAPNV